jgi:hypothetical protein
MIVKTFQHKNVLEELQNNSYYYLKDSSLIDDDYKYYYDWMVSKMPQKNNKYKVNYPIWVYTDLSASVDDHPPALFEQVELILDIPEKLVFQSNHTYTENYIFNYKPIPRNLKEYRNSKKLSKEEMIATWDRIFIKNTDHDFSWDHDFIKPPSRCRWQGCVWYLKNEWLCAYQYHKVPQVPEGVYI